jgi:hypothetical protein
MFQHGIDLLCHNIGPDDDESLNGFLLLQFSRVLIKRTGFE